MSGTLSLSASASRQAFWAEPVLILVLAIVFRVAFFPGALGSDEAAYVGQAYQLLDGGLKPVTYIGAMRYGIIAVQAVSVLLFGKGIAAADGVYFALSLGEVMLAYFFARHLWGRRAALWTGLVMATVPLDVSLAGTLNPDCYIGFVIASALVTFYFAEARDSRALYLVTGLISGWVFLIKEELIVFGLVFVCIVLMRRRWRSGYLWFALGGLFWLPVSCAIFWVIFGDPFHIFHVLASKAADFSRLYYVDSSAWTYFTWLLVKPYHVGLVGWLALAGGVLALRTRHPGGRFVVLWGTGLLLIFSFFPFHLRPLSFMPKQPNYMEIFLLPLVMLAGLFLARQRPAVAVSLGAIVIASGALLAAMEQQVVRVAVANGPAEVAFADAHPDVPIFGPWTAEKATLLRDTLDRRMNDPHAIQLESNLTQHFFGLGPAAQIVAYVIQDPQMRHWPALYQVMKVPPALRACWTRTEQLPQPKDSGLGHWVVGAMRSIAIALPGALGKPILHATDRMWTTAPAQAFAVTRACAQRIHPA